jgi:hypothetical protein
MNRKEKSNRSKNRKACLNHWFCHWFFTSLILLIFKDEQRKKGKRRSGEAEDVDRLDAPIKKQIRPKESLHDKCHKSGTKLHGWTLRWPKNEIFTGALTSNSQFWKFKKMQRK